MVDFIASPEALIVVSVIALVVMVAVAGFFVLRLLMKFRLVHSEMMPMGGKVAFWAALAYTLFPVDVLPDPFLLDDIGVLVMALVYINGLLRGDPSIEAALGHTTEGAAGGDDPPELLGG